MNNEKGYIKIYRSILDWEWWSDNNTCKLFLYILLSANWKDKRWQGIEVKRGEFVTSIDNLASGTNLTKSQVRTSLSKLQSSGEVIAKSQQGKRYTIIRVCKFEEFQDSNEIAMKSQTFSNEIANLSQSNRNEIATTKESKNIKKDKKDKNNKNDKKSIPTRHRYGEFQKVLLSDDELDKLKQEYGTGTTDACITFLDEYIEMKGYKAKNHYLCIRKWVVDAVNERKAKKPQGRNDWIDDWLEQVKEGVDET